LGGVGDASAISGSSWAGLNAAAIGGRSNGEIWVDGGVISAGRVNPPLSLSGGAADWISIRL
jgi:hypothetical protein